MADRGHDGDTLLAPLLADSNLNIIGSSKDLNRCQGTNDVITDSSHKRLDLNPNDVISDHNTISLNPSDGSRCPLKNNESQLQLIDHKAVHENTPSIYDCHSESSDQRNIDDIALQQSKGRKLRRQKTSFEITENELASTSVNLNTPVTSSAFFNEQNNSVLISRKPSPPYQSSTEDMMNGNPPGWDTIRKKLPNIAALQKGALASRRQSKKLVVEQESFLERFSTREYKQEHKTPTYGQRRVSKANVFLGLSKHHSLNAVDRQEKVSFTNSKESAISLMTIAEDNSEETNISRRKGFFFPCKWNSWFEFNFKTVVEPHCNIMYYWQYLLLMAIHYNAWIVIMRISFFQAQAKFASTWFALDYIGDLIYIFDIFICMRISFLENGMYVTDLKRVALRYLISGNFALDAFSLLPLDLLYFRFGPSPILRLPRLMKFYKVFQSRKMIESLTSIPNIIRALFLLHLMFLLIHWNGCLYFMISKAEGFGSNSWVYPKLVGRRSELVNQYIHCFYWATLSLTTIGEGRGGPITLAENIYMIVCYITGIFIFATIVGQAGSVIQNMNASRMDFEKQRDNTMQYMKRHNVPKDLQRRVRLWYDYSYSRGRFQGGDDINEMTLLPNKMKTELALHVHLETLRKVSFLQKVQPDFLHDLVLKMKLHIFTPGDYICRKGEIAREMYVISDGILEVVSETGTVLKVLHRGNFFGEIGILSLSDGQNRRTADVRCCGYVELFVLYKDDVLSAIQDYPETQKILSRYGRKRLNRGNKGGDGSDGETTSESEEEQKIEEEEEEEEERSESPHNKTQNEEMDTNLSIALQCQLPDTNNTPSVITRTISVNPIHEESYNNTAASSKQSSVNSSPARSVVTRQQSSTSVAINMTSMDSPSRGSKSSVHHALISTVNSFLGPASPTIARGTPPYLRRKKFSESRSSSSPSLRKKRLSQPNMTKRVLEDDITTALFQPNGKSQADKHEERKTFKKALSDAHFEALQVLESTFFRKIQKEHSKLKDKIKELEKIVDLKNEEIFLQQLRIKEQENTDKLSTFQDVQRLDTPFPVIESMPDVEEA